MVVLAVSSASGVTFWSVCDNGGESLVAFLDFPPIRKAFLDLAMGGVLTLVGGETSGVGDTARGCGLRGVRVWL